MGRQRALERLLLSVVTAAVVCGCSACGRVPVAVEVKPGRVVLATEAAPPLGFRDHVLAGSYVVVDHTARTGLLLRKTGEEGRPRELALMDLASGRVTTLLRSAVNATAAYEILGYAAGEADIAWEELSPGEFERSPDEVEWRLYTTALDAAGRPGRPVEVDRGRISKKSRPLFAFDGRRLLWVTNESRPGRKSAEGVVRSRDSRSREVTEVARHRDGIYTLRLSEGHAILAYAVGQTGPRTGIRVVRLSDGKTVFDFAPKGMARLAHFPAFADGWLAWAVLEPGEEVRTAGFLREPSGTVFPLGPDAIDPVFAGPYVFWERTTGEGARGGQFTSEIWGSRLGSRRRFKLTGGPSQDVGWWQAVTPAGRHDGVLVFWNDQTPWVPGAEGGRTIVRVYDVSR